MPFPVCLYCKSIENDLTNTDKQNSELIPDFGDLASPIFEVILTPLLHQRIKKKHNGEAVLHHANY